MLKKLDLYCWGIFYIFVALATFATITNEYNNLVAGHAHDFRFPRPFRDFVPFVIYGSVFYVIVFMLYEGLSSLKELFLNSNKEFKFQAIQVVKMMCAVGIAFSILGLGGHARSSCGDSTTRDPQIRASIDAECRVRVQRYEAKVFESKIYFWLFLIAFLSTVYAERKSYDSH